MKIFISWSGDLSRSVATVFSQWLPGVIQECSDPFISTDTTKGDPWFETITTNLKENELGVVFITRENLESTWLNFEAGALLSKFEKSGVRPLLVDLKKGDYKGPMANLQLTEIDDEQDMKLLMKSINERCSKPLSDSLLQKSFSNSWGELRDGVKGELNNAELPKGKPSQRPQGDKIDEILNLVRGIASEPSNDRKTITTPNSFRRAELRAQRLKEFEAKHGSLAVFNSLEENSGEVIDFSETQDGELRAVRVQVKGGKPQTWGADDIQIVPF